MTQHRRFTLVLDPVHDADILTWISDQPHGQGSAAIRDAIRTAWAASDNTATLRRILREELAHVQIAQPQPIQPDNEAAEKLLNLF